ncbi:GNAT family N-acetyltransferase [Janthinobacterium sp. NFX145]|uniref:GNAT family N-acetyltransferase n=1 Tax=Janthinobacterium sp. NFX145 TaxID=3415602 RepID=UPI003CC57468
MTIKINKERAEHINAITLLTEAAFQHEEHSSHTEQFIVNSLRDSGQLTVSLVAIDGESVVGHVAVSPVAISSGDTEWYGLGPISVSPERQGQGIGSQMMKAALEEIQRLGAAGCVVLGNPAYYGRFGFKAHPGLILPGVPQEYFQAISFGNKVPCGDVKFHEAFDATE